MGHKGLTGNFSLYPYSLIAKPVSTISKLNVSSATTAGYASSLINKERTDMNISDMQALKT